MEDRLEALEKKVDLFKWGLHELAVAIAEIEEELRNARSERESVEQLPEGGLMS